MSHGMRPCRRPPWTICVCVFVFATGHPEFVKQFAGLLGARVEGTEGKKLLMLCGDYMEGEGGSLSAHHWSFCFRLFGLGRLSRAPPYRRNVTGVGSDEDECFGVGMGVQTMR